MDDSNKLLLDYARNGSEAAFTELVQRHLRLVYGVALRWTAGDAAAAEDIAQTVFTDLARTARDWRAESVLGGWLHRHTCFVAAKSFRAERRRKTRERIAATMHLPQDPREKTAEITAELDEAINSLEEEDRLAVVLRFFEERDFFGVGQGLGITEEAARKRVSRSLEKLQTILARRGVTSADAGVGGALPGGLLAFTPGRTATQFAASALGGAGLGGGAGGTVFGARLLAAGKIKLATLAVALIAAISASIYAERQNIAALRAENQALHRQIDDLKTQAAQRSFMPTAPTNQRLESGTPPADQRRELLRLRGEVGVLRDQLAKATQAAARAAITPVVASGETADINVQFPGINMEKLAPFLSRLIGKPVGIGANTSPYKSIWLATPPGHLLTRTETFEWVREALKDQANLMLVTNGDGSIVLDQAPGR